MMHQRHTEKKRFRPGLAVKGAACLALLVLLSLAACGEDSGTTISFEDSPEEIEAWLAECLDGCEQQCKLDVECGVVCVANCFR